MRPLSQRFGDVCQVKQNFHLVLDANRQLAVDCQLRVDCESVANPLPKITVI